jgi:hypothetical protein
MWNSAIDRLTKFVKKNGNALVPAEYSDEGFPLGCWVSNRRAEKENLTYHEINELDSLGFIWSAVDERWEKGFTHLKTFFNREGHVLVPQAHVESGYKLGSWVSVQRVNREHLSREKTARLEKLGFSWNKIDAAWNFGFEKFIHYMSEVNEGMPAAQLVYRGFKLGQWVGIQRRSHRKGKLSPERVSLLENAGFVFDVPESQWQTAFQRVIRYKNCHGNSRVPNNYIDDDGFALGAWVKRHRLGKLQLSPEHIQKLESIGFEWESRKN